MAAFLTGGCSEGEPFGHPSAEREKRVEVSFRLEAVGTDVSLVPMTRATSYTQWFRNTARLLILKKADTRWIVDTTQTVLLDAQSGPWAELKIAGDLPPCPFNLELRPGDYRIVAVINWGSADWNNDLVPGKVVSDETDGSLRTPPLLTYTISTHWMNNGYRQLSREVFVAVADFPVPKSGDLHSAGVPPVTLRAERRVAKFRVLLKDKPSPVNGFSFDMTAHTVQMLLTSKTEPFAEGIDALGGMYYGDPALYELPCCMSTMGDFHSSGTERYQMCQTNSTVFSPSPTRPRNCLSGSWISTFPAPAADIRIKPTRRSHARSPQAKSPASFSKPPTPMTTPRRKSGSMSSRRRTTRETPKMRRRSSTPFSSGTPRPTKITKS